MSLSIGEVCTTRAAVRIKVCGVTRAQDLELLLELGVDAVGLMFWPQSARFLQRAEARALSRLAEGHILRVGVFMDAQPRGVREVLEEVDVDVLQFHGRETPDVCAGFGLPWVKAVQVSAPVQLLSLTRQYQGASALMLDGGAGEGRVFDWRRWPQDAAGRRLILAGGLNPDNVAEAVRRLRPWGVDVSTGVESARGVKDADLIRRFVEETRLAASE